MTTAHNYDDSFQVDSDPLDSKEVDFDWEAVFAGDGDSTADDDEIRERVIKAVRGIFEFCTEPLNDSKGKQTDKLIGRRLIALRWVVCPDLHATSLTSLARQMGLPVQLLSPHAADASRVFKIRNRGQSHDWRTNQKTRSAVAAEPGGTKREPSSNS